MTSNTEEFSFMTTLLPLVSIVFVIVLGVIVLTQHFRKNLYRQTLEKEELKNNYQHKLLQASIEVQEKERWRIAQNLHDELGAGLSIARMQLVQLEQQNKGNENLVSALQRVRMATEASLSTMRRISHELMPYQLSQIGLTKTLESLANQISHTEKTQFLFYHDDSLPSLSSNVELGLYRICLELINNALKHSKASEISVRLNHVNNCLVMEYTDDGVGMPKNYTPGHGLKNMEARANSIGGTWEFGNRDVRGFFARICMRL